LRHDYKKLILRNLYWWQKLSNHCYNPRILINSKTTHTNFDSDTSNFQKSHPLHNLQNSYSHFWATSILSTRHVLKNNCILFRPKLLREDSLPFCEYRYTNVKANSKINFIWQIYLFFFYNKGKLSWGHNTVCSQRKSPHIHTILATTNTFSTKSAKATHSLFCNYDYKIVDHMSVLGLSRHFCDILIDLSMWTPYCHCFKTI